MFLPQNKCNYVRLGFNHRKWWYSADVFSWWQTSQELFYPSRIAALVKAPRFRGVKGRLFSSFPLLENGVYCCFYENRTPQDLGNRMFLSHLFSGLIGNQGGLEKFHRRLHVLVLLTTTQVCSFSARSTA